MKSPKLKAQSSTTGPRGHLRPGTVGWAAFLGLGFSILAATPADDLAAMRVLPGFEVTLFASEEQDVVKPIQIRFDPDGRLWVVGSAIYPQIRPGQTPDDKVIVLEDTDGDGRADTSTVFADGLAIPTGLELGDGGVYVGAGAELLHFRDTDGDGRADERRVVLRGFGTGDTHQTINSLNWGPAGELTFSQGLHALSRVETPWGVEELRQSGVWRWWPRRLRLDAFWSGAMGAHNPFGTVFDRWGQPFIFAGNGHGIYHLTQAMIRTDHFLEHRWLWNEGRKFGGAEIVENSRWPAAHQGEFITGGYLHNSVERFRITDAGGTNYAVERLPPLIESTNTAFRIVDLRFGPDAALYLADWHNPVIGHYQASFRDPARDRTRGRIWRVTPAGSDDLPAVQLTTRSTGELVKLFQSPDRWHRQMAKRVLAGRPTEEVSSALGVWLNSLPPGGEAVDLACVEALGVFASHEVIETNLLARLAAAERPEARAFAARVTGHWADRWSGAAVLLERLAVDAHPRVRLEAVVACSYLPDARAVEIAALATDRPMDAALEYAFTQCVHALEPRWRAAQEAGRLTFGGSTARQTAFARALGGRDAARQAAGRLARVVEVALDADTVRQLAQTVADGGTEELAALLPVRHFTVGTNYLAGLHAEALGWAAQAARERGARPADPAARLAPLLDRPEAEVRAGAARLAGLWRVETLRPRVTQLAGDAAAPAVVRQAAFDGVAGFGDNAARATLASAARAPGPAETRAGATTALARLDAPQAAGFAAELLAGPLDGTSVTNLVAAFLGRRDGPAALRDALAQRPPAAANAVPALAVAAGLGAQDARLVALLQQATEGGAAATPATVADIPALVAAARTAGDAAKGRAIFERPALGCVACHSVAGAPGLIGPDLGALGTAQTPEFILGAILEPQREVKEGFVAWEITTTDGATHQGYLRGETAEAVALLDHLEGRVVRLPRARITAQRQLGSLMPAGLVDGLTREELRDLLAYLMGLGRRGL